ncbi:MAG: Asp-tRNA(Asn)/Glu-tRNA(Gln) amidotransferase subunit GatA [Dehalococcoidia bacterium]
MLPHYRTIAELHQLLVRRELSCAELVQAALERISSVDGRVRAFLTVTEEAARRGAEQADARFKEGTATPLTGIPAAIKDNMCTRGVRTSCSSRMLENFVPPYDAAVVERLQGAGMVMVGKTNMDEYAMGSSTENSAFFPTHNPWDLERVPGGSSGGSAAAVAAGEAVYALGSDTGGSIRQPAGFCSLSGLKPTYGLVSRYGLVAFASSLDQIGPLTRSVADCALVLQAIAGHDPRDSTSIPRDVPDYSQALPADLKGLRLGVPQEYFPPELEPGVAEVLRDAIKVLEGLGAQVEWGLSLPSTAYALPVYYILAPSEASANLARYDGVKYGFSAQDGDSMWEDMEHTRQQGFGPEVKRRIMLGTYALSAGYYDAYYLKAQRVRTLIRRELEAAFEQYDALITPSSPTVPFKLGEKVDDPMQMYLSDIFTIPVNIAGIPALTLPAGFADGLPVGMQLMGKALSEETLLRIGHAFQQATDWHKQAPPL